MGQIGRPIEEWDVPEPAEMPIPEHIDEPVPAGR